MFFDLSNFHKRIFFISDTHFGHENIIKLCERPFENADIMDNNLINNWNTVVRDEDIIFHLGDFAWSKEAAKESWAKLNGKIYLLRGNHDHKFAEYLPFLPDTIVDIKWRKKFITLCHYPMVNWYKSRRNSIHLYGHTHRTIPMSNDNTLCVCVEETNYTPVSLDDILITFKQ